MTIASEITRINNNIAAAYTAASNKGATLPATQNSANLATCIGSIPSGSASPTGLKVNVTFENGATWIDVEYIEISIGQQVAQIQGVADFFPIILTGPIRENETVYYQASTVGKGATISPEIGSITLQGSYGELDFVVSID